MKKSFLLPFAVTMAALLNAAPASSKIVESVTKASISRNENGNDIVLSNSDSTSTTIEAAWHTSHQSHSSHSSHASHCSGWDYC